MRHLLILLITVLLTSLAWTQQSVGPVKVIYPTKVDTSPPLRDLAGPVPRWESGIAREIPNNPPIDLGQGPQGLDGALQSAEPTRTLGPPTLNFEGIGINGFLPPDTNFDVGLTHIMQMVNVQTAIWDKAGNVVLAPFASNAFWSGFGGSCEFQNAGDPVVLYDPLAGRWLVSQFADPIGINAVQCIAISTGENPTGSYFRYSFPTPGNDYPKMGVMETVYSATVRNFSGGFNMDAYAFDRARMLVGDSTAALLVFNLSALLPNIDGFLPSDIDGTTPPPTGRDATYMGHNFPNARLAVFELTNVNWSVPTGTLTGPTFLPVAPFDIIFPGVPQPAGPNLDDLAGFLMHRLAYRNFGTYESLVANNAVDVNDFVNHVGIRWYELRDTGGGWTVRQQSTYAPDSDHRWMASIAMNGNGDIMMG